MGDQPCGGVHTHITRSTEASDEHPGYDGPAQDASIPSVCDRPEPVATPSLQRVQGGQGALMFCPGIVLILRP
jgi:hypothetical protein